MEISLAKPQREIFNMMQKHPGSFIRKHKKSLQAKREYWRLLDQEYNPIKNIIPSRMKPFFEKELLTKTGDKEFTIKPDVVLVDNRKKKIK